MTEKQKNQLKKTMTKKEYLALVRKERSQVAMGQNLGTIDMKSKKDYCRSQMKKESRRREMELF